jgi:hypothetical protein
MPLEKIADTKNVRKNRLVKQARLQYNRWGDRRRRLRNRWNGAARRRIPSVGGGSVDDRLKNLMQELGNAINDSLSDSERIAEAIGEIKRAGYDVFLVLEATIGFNKREEGDAEGGEIETERRTTFESTGKIKFTTQDHRFLKALKIAVDEESR